IVGALILMRRPHRIGTLFLGFGLFIAAAGVFIQLCDGGFRELEICRHDSGVGEFVWQASFFFGPLLLLFPTGRLPSQRWVPVATIFYVSWGAIMALTALGFGDTVDAGGFIPVAVWALAACATAPLFRIRKASAIERQQLRYLGYVVAMTFVAIGIGLFLDLSGRDEALVVVNILIFANVALGIPAAIGIAILRYRLYEIDVIINRTLVYGGLTAILAAIYVGLVFGLQAALAPVTAESDLAIAASTLAVAALFRPLRSRVQAFIDRRFYRRKFDSRMTLEEFNAHIRDEVELDSLSAQLVRAVQETMQPAHVSLWLRGQGAGR
ncbi:MAG: hypothetical protein ACRDKT_16495, partial [Actinomycetota bacterium]